MNINTADEHIKNTNQVDSHLIYQSFNKYSETQTLAEPNMFLRPGISNSVS